MKINLFDDKQSSDNLILGYRPGKEGPFRWKTSTFGDCFLDAISDPAVPVFFIVLLIAACVGEWLLSLLLIFSLAGCILFNSLLRFRANSIYSSLNSGLIAPVSIERDGEKKTVRFSELLEGDILTLNPGVILPADAELVSGDKIRVLEQFYDYEKGTKSVRKVEKYINSSRLGDRPDLTDPNIVLAGSTILSGTARASVRNTGSATEISKKLGGIKIAPSERNTPDVKRFISFSRAFSLFFMVLGIPFLLIYVIFFRDSGETGISLISMMLIFLSLVLGTIGGRDSALYDYVCAKELAALSGITRKGGLPVNSPAGIYIPSVADDVCKADTILLMDRSVVGDLKAEVRSVYFDSIDYSGDLIGSSDLSSFSEIALLLSAVHMTVAEGDETDSAFDSFALMQKTDRDFLLRDYSAIKALNGYPRSGDVSASVTYKGELPESYLLTRTDRFEDAKHCRFFRKSDGTLGNCDLVFSEKIDEWLNRIQSKCLSAVFIIACKSGSDIFILEGAVAIGGTFPDFNSDVAAALNESGIRPVLILPEDSAVSVTASKMCGIARDASEIAIASDYLKTGRNLEDGFDKITVFAGFGAQGTKEIVELLAKKSSGIISVVSDIENLRTLKPRSLPLSVSGSATDSVNIACSGFVSSASEHSPSTGIASVFSLFLSVANSRLKIDLLKKLMIFRTVFLIFVVLLPLVTGNPHMVPGPFSIIITALISNVLFLFGTVADKYLPATLSYGSSSGSGPQGRRAYLITGSVAFLAAISVTVTGVLAYPKNGNASAYILFSMLFVLLFTQISFRFIQRRARGLSGVNYFIICSIVFLALLFVINCYFPFSSSSAAFYALTGAATGDDRLALYVSIPSIISVLLIWGSSYIPASITAKLKNHM